MVKYERVVSTPDGPVYAVERPTCKNQDNRTDQPLQRQSLRDALNISTDCKNSLKVLNLSLYPCHPKTRVNGSRTGASLTISWPIIAHRGPQLWNWRALHGFPGEQVRAILIMFKPVYATYTYHRGLQTVDLIRNKSKLTIVLSNMHLDEDWLSRHMGGWRCPNRQWALAPRPMQCRNGAGQ